MKRKVGRPTELDDEFFTKIRELVLDGKNMKETAEILDISYSTMANWISTNYRNFKDIWLSYEQERKLIKAEANIERLMGSENEKISLDASTFIAETLGKNRGYSKRNELTGKNGEALFLKPEEKEVIDKAFSEI